jgi:N-acetyl-anhydromuramyl-L-alanine amidase AmpD
LFVAGFTPYSQSLETFEPGPNQIMWVPSPNFNERIDINDVDTIVLHHTAGDHVGSVKWLMNPDSQVSCHFVVGKEGGIVQMVSLWRRAWHAGASLDAHGRQRVNDFSIGIEISNLGDGFDLYTPAQLEAVDKVIEMVMSQYNIRQIVSHEYIAEPQGRKNDPLNYPWERLQRFNVPLYYGRKPAPSPSPVILLPDRGF